MSVDFRALCAELLDEVVARPLYSDRALIDRARAALSEPADGPATEGEVAELVAAFREEAAAYVQLKTYRKWERKLTRAAELLAQCHAAPADGPTFRDAIQLAQGCHDYSGGYGGTPCAEAFHAGIATVVSVLRKASSGPWDHQTQAVFAIGALPLPAQAGEVE